MGRSSAYNRDDLIQKIITCFWQKGYEGTSVRDLVAATKVNVTSLYWLFDSKKGMMLEALKVYAAARHARLRTLLDNDEPCALRLCAIMHELRDQSARGMPSGCFLISTLPQTANDPLLAETVLSSLEGMRVMIENALSTTPLRQGITPRAGSIILQGLMFSIGVFSCFEQPGSPNDLIRETLAMVIEQMPDVKPPCRPGEAAATHANAHRSEKK